MALTSNHVSEPFSMRLLLFATISTALDPPYATLTGPTEDMDLLYIRHLCKLQRLRTAGLGTKTAGGGHPRSEGDLLTGEVDHEGYP